MSRTSRSRTAGMTMMELLIVCVIGSIVTGGIIMLWFNINKSSALTTSHAETRDFARDGVARLVREIRDAEVLDKVAIIEAQPTSIAFTTTFNKSGNDVDTTKPRLVRYELRPNASGQLGLYRDLYADGVTTPAGHTPVRTMVIVPYVLNDDVTPPFSYTYVDSTGQELPAAGDDAIHNVADDGDRSRILLVGIHVRVDLDPGKAPNAMDITTEAQIRNQRIIE